MFEQKKTASFNTLTNIYFFYYAHGLKMRVMKSEQIFLL